jgi:ABC-type nitrate/sulfonate/bicarbonate transport system ATPase subunit
MPALACRSLALAWQGAPIVEDVSLELAPGEVSCLVGRSGCGKTTLFHGLAGLTTPTSGEVLVHGRDVTGTPGQVSYMLQKDLLLPNRTVLDNVCLPLRIAGVPKAEARAKAMPLFARFGLEGTQDSWPSQLSGGMRQRAALLRTYLMDNDVVLLDEPFSALDAITRAEIRSWFVGMAHELGLTTLVVTHDVDEAVLMSRRVFVMRGDPMAGRPSMIVGEVEVTRPAGLVEGFDLTDEFRDAKREVLGLLG